MRENKQYRLCSIAASTEERLENYLVKGLIDYDDISYDDHSALLYKLAGQLIAKLRTYLKDDAEIRNVLLYCNDQYVRLIHGQMQKHFDDGSPTYEVHVSKGFTAITPSAFNAPADEEPRPFRTPVDEKRDIRKMLFGGFIKCLFPIQKFDSDPERRFAVVLENDPTVAKWVKPNKKTFQIHYEGDANYEPDFVVEAADAYYLCEPKQEDEIPSAEVQAKAQAAALWCHHATSVASKPWHYLLIPHNAINESKTLAGFAAQFEVTSNA